MAETTERPKHEIAVIQAKDMFVRVAGEEKWDREAAFALQTIRKNDVLQRCPIASIKEAVVNLALTGATLNPALHQAYLVPRDGLCCLDISYRGLIKIATDTGAVRKIHAQVVYDFDHFDYEQGSEPYVRYRHNLDPPEDFRKDPTAAFWKHVLCAFAVATLPDGTKDISIMPRWKLWKNKQTSKAQSGKAPWATHPDEMARKSVIKYLCKTLPQTDSRLAQAIHVLNEHEGIEPARVERTGKAADVASRFADAEVAEYEDPLEAPFTEGGETELFDEAGEA